VGKMHGPADRKVYWAAQRRRIWLPTSCW
jgi:hypothetical protein